MEEKFIFVRTVYVYQAFSSVRTKGIMSEEHNLYKYIHNSSTLESDINNYE